MEPKELLEDYKELLYEFIVNNKVDKTFRYVNKEHITFDHVYDDWEGNNFVEFSLGPSFLNSSWVINIPLAYFNEERLESFLISKKHNRYYLYRK